MLDDLALEHVTWAQTRQSLRLLAVPVVGLAGDAQQNLGRASHEISLAGVLVGEEAATQLAALQEKAASGTEMDFTADIATALELTKVILAEAHFTAEAGQPGRYGFHLTLRESPPLPPPAVASPFGGLDLGFDPDALGDVLGDIAAQAGELQALAEAAGSALQALEALSGLGDLALGNPLTPLQQAADRLSGTAEPGAGAALNRTLEG